MHEGYREPLQFLSVPFPLHRNVVALSVLFHRVALMNTHRFKTMQLPALQMFVAQLWLRKTLISTVLQLLRVKNLPALQVQFKLNTEDTKCTEIVKCMHSVQTAFGGGTVFPLMCLCRPTTYI